jgi:hypothetical protein
MTPLDTPSEPVERDSGQRDASGETYTIVLRPVGSVAHGVPVEVRLKRFLKAALRAYGFRCTCIRPGGDG